MISPRKTAARPASLVARPGLLLVLVALFVVISGCSILSNAAGNLLGDVVTGDASLLETAEAAGEIAEAGSDVIQSVNETFTPEQQYYVGRGVAATILAQYEPYRDPDATEYINTLGQALGLSSPQPFLYRGYRFMILDSDEINAFATPGGHIFVTRGMIRLAESEDELAAILAHEITHVVLQHGMKSIKSSRITGSVLGALRTTADVLTDGQIAELTESFSGSVDDVAEKLVTSGYSRATERDADAGAVAILASVGYDPMALVRVLEKMADELEPGGRDFAKTHPDPDVRVRWIEDMIEELDSVPSGSTQRTQSRFEAAVGSL